MLYKCHLPEARAAGIFSCMNTSTLTEAERNDQAVALVVSSLLKNFRQRHSLTQEALAKLLPVDLQSIVDLENGTQEPPRLLKRALHDLDHELTVKAMRSADRAAPLYRSGPMTALMQKQSILIRPVDGSEPIAQCQRYSNRRGVDETMGNARLLIGAYNAFDAAARRLGVNAVELAEGMADGGLAELVKARDGSS